MRIIDSLRDLRKVRYIRKLRERGLILGEDVYLNDGFFLDPAHCHLIEIQDRVVFGPRVMVFAHDASAKKAIGKTIVGLVTIERDVFVGAGAIILPGTTIGSSSVVGSGSVVRGIIPAQEVWVGNPARRLCSLSEYREKLLGRGELDFSESEYASSTLTLERRESMRKLLQENRYGFMVGK